MKDIKLAAGCFAGALGAVGLLWGVYFSGWPLPFLSLGLWSFGDWFEGLSWRSIAAALGVATLFLEAMTVQKRNRGHAAKELALAVRVSTWCSLLFLALCWKINESLMDWPGAILGLGALAASRFAYAFECPEKPVDPAQTQAPKEPLWSRVIGPAIVFGIFGFFALFAWTSLREGAEMSAVAQKYEAEVMRLGITRVRESEYDSFRRSGGELMFKWKRGEWLALPEFGGLAPEKETLAALGLKLDPELEDSRRYQSPFHELELSVNGGRLRILGLDYDPAKTPRPEMIRQLDTVMSQVVMPKLRKAKAELDARERNEKTYED